MIIRPRKVLIILACMVAACNGTEDQPNADHQVGPADTPTVQNSAHTGSPVVTVPDGDTAESSTLPQQKQDSISLEGMTEPITLKLVHQKNADPPFTTYMPGDFTFEPVSSGEGAGYYFYTNFGGTRNPNAYLLVHVLPANTSRDQAVARVNAWVASRVTPKPPKIDAFTFKKEGTTYAAGIDLRQHGNRFYYVARNYPIEMADGFGPRAAKINENWKWLD